MIDLVNRISINGSATIRFFVYNFLRQAIRCTYENRQCSPDCVCCEMKEYDACHKEANCIRGEFTIGYVTTA